MEVIKARHIQMADDSSMLEPHWGYVDRVLPCTNDAGSCEYLDAVYHTHDISMLYTFILWAVIGGLIVIISTLHFLKPSWKPSTVGDSEIQSGAGVSSWYYRAWRGTAATFRRHLLPESRVKFFRHVTRLQVLILAILLGYLLIFTFVGNVYKTWITPVKKTNLFNTRTGLGGFSDRLGALAYALTPFTVLLSTRESVLSLATGIPYQSFNFLHRWLGRIIFIQAAESTSATSTPTATSDSASTPPTPPSNTSTTQTAASSASNSPTNTPPGPSANTSTSASPRSASGNRTP
ncbi:hypothetical protein EYC80_002934 [Monilinia laxa]|uniref:Ferric oxidoreductase domain-containing protein n=1 Tax=Monilinia laxa TaxID=61186 RepID=A0A5N6KC82_MONLA|nr:hypothetical protein EYC80_002934 [Monilinia laxa]